MDEIEAGSLGEAERWPARPFLLAGLGLAAGILIHLILGTPRPYDMVGDAQGHAESVRALHAGLFLGLTLGGALIGFTIERRLWWASLLFGGAMGVAAFLVSTGNGAPGEWGAGDLWRTMGLLLALVIAAPLFQASRDERTLRPSYAGVYDNLWANVVLWCVSWVLVAVVWAVVLLLGSLFHLIGIDTARDIFGTDAGARALTGLAFGGALGLLREQAAMVRTLQRVLRAVLAVLAPVMAIGLGLFLLILPFAGMEMLSSSRWPATALLLGCAAGALILVNVVIGRDEADERRAPVIRVSAMILAAVILPLAVVAAVATGMRVEQYGYTPERLWALVCVGAALCWGAAYFGALLLRRRAWSRVIRQANLILACMVCVLGLLLALPLLSFNRIATDNQVARLESGTLTLDQFDWAALAYDFGEPGRDALRRLARDADPAIRARASEVAKAPNRWVAEHGDPRVQRREQVRLTLRILPAGHPLPAELQEQVANGYPCAGEFTCTLAFIGNEAFLFSDACMGSRMAGRAFEPTDYCRVSARWVLADGKWGPPTRPPAVNPAKDREDRDKGYDAGDIEIRQVRRRQAFVGGQPVGEPFE